MANLNKAIVSGIKNHKSDFFKNMYKESERRTVSGWITYISFSVISKAYIKIYVLSTSWVRKAPRKDVLQREKVVHV